MAKGNKIIVSAEPKGRFLEGYISGTPKPGTVVELKWTTAIKGGRWTWEAAVTTAATGANHGMAANGDRLPITILVNDELRGKLITDAYVDGDRCFLYQPAIGEEVNVLVANLAGTADDHTIGEKMMVEDGTGKMLVSVGAIEAEPFVLLENITDPVADTLAWAYFTGY